ncbi:LysR family transcriptional regulator [Pseudoduganella namucuonensis]|uniref:DNA-binding transcriptional regulator, LysR family n=1 Tax=Pseudoduganella namucuonensis TaxID=1035707 RepID=A0A1I7IKJ1_9BURK|nr:LysR family transcriptional regulator [Pseudoduganella namucuonensis]SFU73405.1 DNA-binding transcriptional regulator, LysR family [Pseudoduganella namucuonensis]
MDKMRSMEVFVRVVDAGNFTAAARALNLSTVMVSKHIAALEKLVGARLLHRTTRSQSLTEIGAQYCEECRHILALVEAAERGAQSMRAAPRGTLKVSAPVAFGGQCLAGALADYLERHPEVNVELELSNRLADVVEEGLDAAIRVGHLKDTSMVARALRPIHMAICAAPAYLARHGTPQKPADLARHHCLDFSHWPRHVRWRLDEAEPAFNMRASRLRSNNGHALKQAALAGAGIVMQPEMMLADEIARGLLVPVLGGYLPPPRPLHLIYPRDRQSTPKLASFVEFIVERFGAGAAGGASSGVSGRA